MKVHRVAQREEQLEIRGKLEQSRLPRTEGFHRSEGVRVGRRGGCRHGAGRSGEIHRLSQP